MKPLVMQPSAAQIAYVAQAPLRQQLGQMLLVGFAGTKPDDAGIASLRAQAEAGEVGGVIFFGYNIKSPEQLRALIGHMKSWHTPLPLLICVDQEGGAVQRLKSVAGFHGWPSAQEVAAMPAAEAEAAMDGLANELQQLGFNVNFAPCADLLDPASPAIGARGRSYGVDSQAVGHWAGLQMAAHRRHNVRSAIKHFPGHGSAQGDTHRGLTDATPYWRRDELAAFGALIATCPVDAVMTSHLIHRRLDPSDAPVTFSKPIVQDLLRGDLGYDGVVVTDDLGMGALVHDHSLGTIVERAIAAGHDLLLFGQNAAAAGRGARGHAAIDNLLALSVQGVEAGVAAGRLDANRLRESLGRIVSFKFLTAP